MSLAGLFRSVLDEEGELFLGKRRTSPKLFAMARAK